ncbi:hypothetical protein LINPERHAP2_LOCUS19030, partial [Linum perenne]
MSSRYDMSATTPGEQSSLACPILNIGDIYKIHQLYVMPSRSQHRTCEDSLSLFIQPTTLLTPIEENPKCSLFTHHAFNIASTYCLHQALYSVHHSTIRSQRPRVSTATTS